MVLPRCLKCLLPGVVPSMMASSVAVHGSGTLSVSLLLSVGKTLSEVVGVGKVLVVGLPRTKKKDTVVQEQLVMH